jgi:fatty-acyl-CoA synthase
MTAALADGPLTVTATLEHAARQHGARDAIVMGQLRLTHADVLAEARRTAGRLAAQGVGRGTHVGLLMPNCIEYLLIFYGCALLGATAVHFNHRYRREDLAHVIPDSDVELLFVSARGQEFADFDAMLRGIFPELAAAAPGAPLALAGAPRLKRLVRLHDAAATDPWPPAPALAPGAVVHAALDPEDIALIMYTSGTTAHPKGCRLSHRALEWTGRALARRFQMSANDRFWDPLPFFHMSTMLPLAACRAAGACFIGLERFEAGAAAREIAAERATILYPSFPTLTNELFAHPDFDAAALRDQVRIVNNVGPPDLLRRYHERLPAAVHVTAYGLTEAGGVVAYSELDDTLEQRLYTCGRPFDGVDIRMVDPATGAVRGAGEEGEIQIRGACNFSGYHRDPDKTRATLVDGGWVRSGDRGALEPGGRILYRGRLKDMLKVGGENVAAVEIESHLCTHPAIKMAQVVGVPDERLDEVGAAFLELQPGASITRDEVVRHCLGRIASYKIPRYVYVVDEWPMSATKIQKFRLRERVQRADRLRLEDYR